MPSPSELRLINVLPHQSLYRSLSLCIQYADYDLQENLFDFELWIKVDNNGVFEYVYMHTWTFMDDQTIVPLYNEELGEDGVVEFVLGDCVVTPTDLLLAPWPWIN